jgi:hypothetical protein
MGVLIGVDIGQKRDPTAICIAEEEERAVGGRFEKHFVVRYLERLPLGTPYPAVAARIDYLAAGARNKAGSSPTVYMDATGVGQPVVEVVRQRACCGMVVGVYFTHGDRRTEALEGGYRRVTLGKAHLVSRLQTLFQCDRLHLPRSREATVLTEELLSYEIRVDEDANDRYGAFKVGTHDDLVTALGLAVQVDPLDPVAMFGGAKRLSRERKRREAQRRQRLGR